MIVFMAYYLASLLDPIAMALCAWLGFLFKNLWASAIAGALAYAALTLIMPGIHMLQIILISKLCAGATFGLIGAALGRWLRPARKHESPDA